MPFVALRRQGQPFEVVQTVTLLLASSFILFTDSVPPSLRELSSRGAQMAWAWALLIGALAALTGLWWRWDGRDGVLIEMGGLLVAGSACIVYGVALILANPLENVVLPLGFVSSFGVAAIWRALQLLMTLRRAVHSSQQFGQQGSGSEGS